MGIIPRCVSANDSGEDVLVVRVDSSLDGLLQCFKAPCHSGNPVEPGRRALKSKSPKKLQKITINFCRHEAMVIGHGGAKNEMEK
jgi:hypothetical protein